MNDVSFLEKLEYDLLVCDEAHKAKNLKGKTLSSLQRYQADFRLLLTGTPLVRLSLMPRRHSLTSLL